MGYHLIRKTFVLIYKTIITHLEELFNDITLYGVSKNDKTTVMDGVGGSGGIAFQSDVTNLSFWHDYDFKKLWWKRHSSLLLL